MSSEPRDVSSAETASPISRALIVVTGASSGFGKMMALELCRQLHSEDLYVILMSRNTEELKAAKAEILGQEAAHNGRRVEVYPYKIDLSKANDLDSLLQRLTAELPEERYSRAFLVNNAGSLGQLAFAHEYTSAVAIAQYMSLNVAAPFAVTSWFLRLLGAARSDTDTSANKDRAEEVPVYPPREDDKAGTDGKEESTSTPGHNAAPFIIINVSSLAAIEPFHTWGLYCAGKAARNMFSNVIALEQSSHSKFKTLNYAPGPLDTAMQSEIRNSSGIFGPQKEFYTQSYEQGKLVQPRDSARKCVQLVLKNEFTSGSHVDFYDV